MAWKKAATSSDKESDKSLLGTTSLFCWLTEAWGDVVLCKSLLTLVGDDDDDAIITYERDNSSLPLFTSSWWLTPVWDSPSDLNNMSCSLIDISEREPRPRRVCLEAIITTEWFAESSLQWLLCEFTVLRLVLIFNQVIILSPSCLTITLTSSAAEERVVMGEVSLLSLTLLSIVKNIWKNTYRIIK